MTERLVLRAPTLDDVDAITGVIDAQDIAWWGEPEGDADDTRGELDRVVQAYGTLDAGARVATVDGAIVGVGLLVGHGQTSLSVEPDAEHTDAARFALVEWLSNHDGDDIEAPAQDTSRLAQLAAFGYVASRSSFDLERTADLSDLPHASWPDGIVPVPFRLGVDDDELHAMIYSFWTDVPGHTQRPIDEWRSVILAGSWFDADLIVVARTDHGVGPLVGCALGRTFTATIGWVNQLAVAPTARGLGLGRALLLEACHRLARTDAHVIGLSVEAANANALGLYRSVGMEITREWVHCVRQ